MKLKLSGLLADTRQLTRVIILAGILLALVVFGFGGYYYYDRYYRPQPNQMKVTISEAEKMVAEDPQNTDKRGSLAELYLLNRRYEDAISQASQIMMSDPENQRAWLVIGVANALNGKPADAVEPLQKYVDANKDSEMPGLNKSLQSAAYYLGDSYLQLGQPDQAIGPLEMVVDWSQTDADGMYKLGLAYSGVQDYNKALAMFYAATTFVPDYYEVYQSMAEVYDEILEPGLGFYARGMAAYSKKDYKNALDLLQKAAWVVPDFPPTYAGLGLVYEMTDNLPDAKTSYEKAIELDANNYTAITGLARVEALLKK